MSILKSKHTKALAILTVATAILLGSTGSAKVYAASQGSPTNASQVTINLMKAAKKDLKTNAKPAKDFKITLNGKAVTLSDPILSDNGSTLLPLRAIGELLGVDINYDADYKVAIASDKDTVLEVPLGYNFGVRNSKMSPIPNNTRSTVYNSKTYLPLRYMSESLGVTINYMAATKTIAITTQVTQVTAPPTQPPTDNKPVGNPAPNPTETPTPTTSVNDNSPQAVFDRGGSVKEVGKQYKKKFKSVEEVKKVIPQIKNSRFIKENMYYVVVETDITSQRFYVENHSYVATKQDLFITGEGMNNCVTVFKDGTYITNGIGVFPDNKTLKDVSHVAYSRGDTFMIIKINKVDTTGFLF